MNVKFFATLREIINEKELDIELSQASSVKQLIQVLIEKYPALEDEILDDKKNIKRFTHILVNGRNIIHLDGVDTQLKSSDEIAFIPPVGGG